MLNDFKSFVGIVLFVLSASWEHLKARVRVLGPILLATVQKAIISTPLLSKPSFERAQDTFSWLCDSPPQLFAVLRDRFDIFSQRPKMISLAQEVPDL